MKKCSCGRHKARAGQGTCRWCHRAYMRRWRKDHPLAGEARLRSIARSYANVYQQRGKLIPKPCEVCGSLKVEKHHDDYSKPLEVRWFCREHHLALRIDPYAKYLKPRTPIVPTPSLSASVESLFRPCPILASRLSLGQEYNPERAPRSPA